MTATARSWPCMPPDDFFPYAYVVRNGSKRRPGQAIVSATAFTAHYGIATTATRRWKPFVEDGMLCVNLTEAGTVITGNCTEPTARSLPADAEAGDVGDSSAPPAGDAADQVRALYLHRPRTFVAQ
jgi:hypothetical protein